MEASKMLKDDIGDLVTVDVGGATTDIHSVTEGSEEIDRILLSPEPVAKRTVEGDLGVFVNVKNIIDIIGEDVLIKDLDITKDEFDNIINNYKAIPKTNSEKKFVERLVLEATIISSHRHAGGFRDLFANGGKKTLAEGKDLTSIKYIVGTGGALTRLPNRIGILNKIAKSNKGDKLLPNKDAKILIDNDYIMASLGVLSKEYREAALILLKKSLKIN